MAVERSRVKRRNPERKEGEEDERIPNIISVQARFIGSSLMGHVVGGASLPTDPPMRFSPRRCSRRRRRRRRYRHLSESRTSIEIR